MIRHYVAYAFSAFFLNFFWEIWHAAYLYEGWNKLAKNYMLPLTRASLIDVLMLLGILAVGILIWKKADWFLKMNRSKYTYFISASLIVAIIVEFKGVYWLKKWQYSEAMPVIFGIGLSPLVQLALTGLLALWLARLIK